MKKSAPIARFMSRVTLRDGCYIWDGSKANGYGTIKINGRMILAHRYAYETWVEPLGDKRIYPICGHRDCVNYQHWKPKGNATRREEK